MTAKLPGRPRKYVRADGYSNLQEFRVYHRRRSGWEFMHTRMAPRNLEAVTWIQDHFATTPESESDGETLPPKP